MNDDDDKIEVIDPNDASKGEQSPLEAEPSTLPSAERGIGHTLMKITSVLRSKGLYDLVPDKEEKRRDEKGQFVAKDKDPIRLERSNHAHAIMYTRIHSSLTGRLSQNEGKTCPIALWSNIQAFGASKKKANAFKAWVKLNGLVLRADNIPQFTTDYWNCIATLQSYDAVIEPVSLGHSLLAKLPPGLSHIRDSLISTGSTSEVEVTYETVLDMLDSQLSSSPPIAKSITASPLPKFDSGEATALLTKRCPEGRHLPSASHPAEKCFSLLPKALKSETEAEAHLTTLLGPSMFNVEVDRSGSSSIDKLTETFNQLPGNLVSDDADGYESEAINEAHKKMTPQATNLESPDKSDGEEFNCYREKSVRGEMPCNGE
ncbi:hypothetical protein PSTT_01515, partial [Puccinia striiformis]